MIMTKSAVYNALKVSMFKLAFFAWLRDVETVAYNKGYRDGFEAGKPKEQYQGEFGIRSNY